MFAPLLFATLAFPQDAGALDGPFVPAPVVESHDEPAPERQDSAVPS